MTRRLAPELRAVQEAIQARDQAWKDNDLAFTDAVLQALRREYSQNEVAEAAGITQGGVRKARDRGLARERARR